MRIASALQAFIGAWVLLAFPHFVSAGDRLPAFVSILPQKYFVEKIGGDHVTVSVMVQPGASPATYEPRPRQMADLSAAKLYFAVGVPFENAWLDRIASTGKNLTVIHTEKGVSKKPMDAHHHEDEDHVGYEDHTAHDDHAILDPHIWLSPPHVEIQAENILDALTTADPDHAIDYESNYDAFTAELKKLDAELRAMFAPHQGKTFMVFHPSWGYFADAYGLNQSPVELEGKAPKPADLKQLIDFAGKKGINTIFVQPQFSKQSASVIANAIKGQVVTLDPLAENWDENLRDSAWKIRAAVRNQNLE